MYCDITIKIGESMVQGVTDDKQRGFSFPRSSESGNAVFDGFFARCVEALADAPDLVAKITKSSEESPILLRLG